MALKAGKAAVAPTPSARTNGGWVEGAEKEWVSSAERP
jgi:hypothetical protein